MLFISVFWVFCTKKCVKSLIYTDLCVKVLLSLRKIIGGENVMKKNFGEVMSEARRNLKIPMRQLAEKMGWSLSLVSEIEHGRRGPPAEKQVLIKLARILKLELDSLIDRSTRERIKPQKDEKIMNFFKTKGEVAMTMCREADDLDEKSLLSILEEIRKRKNEVSANENE